MRSVKVVKPDPFPHGAPTRDNCDRNNPHQAYLWGLVQMPRNMWPVQYWMLISERLFSLFGPPDPDWVPQKAEKLGPRKPLAEFPTREVCDPTDPRQAYLWGLAALPFQRGGPLVFGVEELEAWSVKLWELFGPPNPVWEPRLVYRLPDPAAPGSLISAGEWMEVE